jgi:hypothetical protein
MMAAYVGRLRSSKPMICSGLRVSRSGNWAQRRLIVRSSLASRGTVRLFPRAFELGVGLCVFHVQRHKDSLLAGIFRLNFSTHIEPEWW